jgi:antitoxin VapB
VALNIANPQVERKAIRVSRLIGRNKTAAVEAALDYFLAHHGEACERPAAKQTVARVLDELASLQPLDHRTADQIIGYDEHGLP